MVYQIIFRQKFKTKLENTLNYLEGEFGFTVSQKFALTVERKLKTLQQQPFIGRTPPTFPNIKSISASLHNRIYYRIQGRKIIVLNMYDTRINPKRNRFE